MFLCPAEKATVSEEGSGVIMFSLIFDTTPVVSFYVEPGLSTAWYAMVNGFISRVDRQTLYGEHCAHVLELHM